MAGAGHSAGVRAATSRAGPPDQMGCPARPRYGGCAVDVRSVWLELATRFCHLGVACEAVDLARVEHADHPPATVLADLMELAVDSLDDVARGLHAAAGQDARLAFGVGGLD